MTCTRSGTIKEVFPSLREWRERRKLRLVDVDLRWGVTEADATKHKRVVDVCLRKIDDCRPFFTGACLRTLEGHTDSVSSVALHPDRRRGVTGSYDNTVRV